MTPFGGKLTTLLRQCKIKKISSLVIALFAMAFVANSQTTISRQVITDNDDAEQKISDGNVNVGSNDLQLTMDGSNNQIVGIRFTNLTIPVGATITNAYITFTSKDDKSGATSISMKCQAADNAPTFTTTNSSISARPTTLSFADWSNIPAWTKDNTYNTPDLSSVVQEVVGRSGWSSGNSIVFIITGSGERKAYSYDGSSTKAPVLTITYITQPPCTCSGNLVNNPSFENGTTGWTWTGGTLSAGTGAVVCGTKSGDLNNTSSSSLAYQTIGTDLPAGTTINARVFSGTHDNTFNNWVAIRFLDVNNVQLAASVFVQVDKVLAASPTGPQLYIFSGTVPAGAKYTQVAFGGNGSYTKTDQWCVTSTPPDNLTLGNKVFYDFNRSGMFDAGDGFVANTIVRLYTDNNNDNVPDGAFIQATTTNAFGEYSFTGLNGGNYIVGVVIPSSYAITVVNGGDPDNNIDDDNNALYVVGNEARGNAITLATGTEPGGGDINNTYDFGFYNPIAPPNGGESCFAGVNPVVFAKSYWNANVNSQTVTIRVTFAKTFVDNTYGTNAIGWSGGHTFNNLVGSDHLQWSIRDGNGVEKLAFKQDYISADATAPSGYSCLGYGGDGGTPTTGLASDVLSFRTSLATNFNDYGYVLTTNSPATNATYSPNATYPNWIYEVWYEVTVKASVFGAAGFGFVNVASVHASPSKTGNNTEIITNNPCAAGSIGDRVWNDLNKDGVQDANEVGLAGVAVSLYDNAGVLLSSTVTDGYGDYKFSNLETSTGGINYQVRFSLVPGYQFSPNTGAITVTNNSDANPATGRTGNITLTNAAPNVTYVDAGMYYSAPARLGDFVWNDLNNNGIQDAGEPGIAGVTVMLYTSGNVLYRSTVTSNNGSYFFNDVAPGTYYVKVTPPIGYKASPKDATTDGADSDIDPVTFKTGNYTVVNGTNNLTIDAGFNVTPTTGASASIGDKVWEDLNNNNVQDAGEPGLPNITVQLYNSANVLQATGTTDAFGNYIFNGLTPGDYYVKFTLPSGFSYVTPYTGSDETKDSDVDGSNGAGTTGLVTVVADQIITTIDAGMRRTTAGANLGDFVWYDLNKNGVQDGGAEVGVPGITVVLYNSANTVVATTTTDINGFYLFTGLAASTSYTVGFENIPAGYGFSPNVGVVTVTNNSDVNPATGRTGAVTTGAAGTTVSYVDAGLIITPNRFDSKSSIGDKVWNDLNNNGIQDAGEPGIGGVTVTLYAANGTTVIATTITDALGNYLFTNLDAGTYVLGFSGLPAGYVFASKDAGSDDTKDSDVNSGTGKTDPFALGAGEINLTIDAGARNSNTSLSSIGNFVWYDVNSNGIQDSGEPGAAGISVRLTDMANNIVGNATTSAIGEYLFTDLAAGNYFVQFGNLPAGYTATTKNAAGSNATNNSDATVATLKSDIIVLPASTSDLKWDMGIVSTTRASLGDFVWNDLNGNGRQDAGEPGVAGVTVTLFDNSNVAVAQTVTDANGFYFFSNILPGTYSVGFSTIPASSTFTIQNAGIATAVTNSDVNPATGRTATFTLVGGQSKTDVDAGLVSYKAAVGDFVWNDLNQDGIQDAGEVGVAGVTVTMYRSTNATIGDGDDVAVASAVTDANGYYLINDVTVAAGGSQFYMRYTDVPTKYTSFTLPLVGGTGAANNSKVEDQDLSNGRTGFFSLSPNQIYRSMDAGIYKSINLSGHVWHDANGMADNLVNNSGALQTPPASQIPNLYAYLVNANTGLVEQVVDVDPFTNQYSFTNLSPNTNYQVIVTTAFQIIGGVAPPSLLPTSWLHTGQQLGLSPGNDGLNDGILEISVGEEDIIDANFGIRKRGNDIVTG